MSLIGAMLEIGGSFTIIGCEDGVVGVFEEEGMEEEIEEGRGTSWGCRWTSVVLERIFPLG